MKKILTIFSLSVLLCSCQKTGNNEEPKKIIERAFFCFEKPMISKSDSIFIGVRYFKNYTQTDKISVTINGKTGEIKGPRVDVLEGTNYFFKFAPISNAGDAEVELIIENDQNTYTRKKILRIADNYNIETIWDKLDNQYILNSFPLMHYASSENFDPIPDYSLGFTVGIGTYLEINLPRYLNNYPSFLSGINGRYILNYDDSKKLKDIKVLNGDPRQTPEITYQKIVNEVDKIYGPVISVVKDYQGKNATKFQTSRLNILVYENEYVGTSSSISTIISLK